MIWLLREKDRGTRLARWGGLIALAVIVLVVVRSEAKIERERKEQRAAEKAKAAEVAEVIAAKDEKLKAAAGLEGKILELEDSLAEVGAQLRLAETAHTVTDPINVQLRELLLRRTAELARVEREAADRVQAAIERVRRERPECEGFIRPEDCPPRELPDFELSFVAETDEARLETDAGNTFAVGLVTLWEGVCEPGTDGRIAESAECILVGSEGWRSDVSELVKPPLIAKRRRIGYYAGGAWAAWQRELDLSESIDRLSLRGGLDIDAWKGWGVQLGGDVNTERAELEFALTYHGTR